jgi:hypothetical protein
MLLLAKQALPLCQVNQFKLASRSTQKWGHHVLFTPVFAIFYEMNERRLGNHLISL